MSGSELTARGDGEAPPAQRLADLMNADEIAVNDDLQRAANRPLTMTAARQLFLRSQDVVFTAAVPVRSATVVRGEGDWPHALSAHLNLYPVPLDDLQSDTAPVGKLELRWDSATGASAIATEGARTLDRAQHRPPTPPSTPANAHAAPKRNGLRVGVVLGTVLLLIGAATLWRGEPVAQREAASAMLQPSRTTQQTRPELDDLRPHVSTIRASCPTLPSSGEGYTYGTDNLLDGDLTTTWQESVPGDGEGQWLEVHFDKPMDVLRVTIAGGYQRHRSELGDLYRLNGRPSGVRVALDGMDERESLLVDEPTWQPLEASLSGVCVMRLTLTGVYPGERWQDTAISELRIEGRVTGETFYRAGGNREIAFKNRGCPHQL